MLLNLCYFNTFSIQVTVSEIPVHGGNYIYMIDKVLFPKSLDKLINNFCEKVTSVEVPGPCGACGRRSNLCHNGDDLTSGKRSSSVSA